MTKISLKTILGRTFTTLLDLQTLIVEIEAILNDRPLTHLSFDVTDPEPLTPSHLIYGCRIVMLLHLHCEDDEISDTTYGETDSQLKGRAKVEAQLLKHFWK